MYSATRGLVAVHRSCVPLDRHTSRRCQVVPLDGLAPEGRPRQAPCRAGGPLCIPPGLALAARERRATVRPGFPPASLGGKPAPVARILITGVCGQVGSYAAEQLRDGGHTVLGIDTVRERMPAFVIPVEGRLTPDGIDTLLKRTAPIDAIIHLAGRSSVAASWDHPIETFDSNARLTTALVFALKAHAHVRLVHASSAEIFGRCSEALQNESTPLRPASPYGSSKAAAHLAVAVARQGLGLPASNLICYVGESERRAAHFAFRKITSGLVRVSLGLQSTLRLGNTAAVRDFCHARDLASAAIMLALDAEPGDYVCASGVPHTVADVARVACDYLRLEQSQVVESDPTLFRPTDIPSLVGDSSKLRRLGWAPSMTFEQLVKTVVDFDLTLARTQGAQTARG